MPEGKTRLKQTPPWQDELAGQDGAGAPPRPTGLHAGVEGGGRRREAKPLGGEGHVSASP